MIELNSSELCCTTHQRLIYDRLPDPLQAKWRRSARLYRDKTAGLYRDKTAGLYRDKTSGLYRDKTAGLYRDKTGDREPTLK